ELILKSLGLSDAGPNRFIVLQGKPDIDDYSERDLQRFPVLVLYGFGVHDTGRAAKLLASYVHHGGGLVVEAAGVPDLAAALAAHGAQLPVQRWQSLELDGSWQFSHAAKSVVGDLDVSQFSPAYYAGAGPYLVELGKRLRAGAT